MRLFFHMLLFVVITFLSRVSDLASQEIQKPTKTSIEITTFEWSRNKGYETKKAVKVLVFRGGARVAPIDDRDKNGYWESDAKGNLKVEVANGDPITVAFHFSEKYKPVIQNLAAAGDGHVIRPALISIDEYKIVEINNPNARRANDDFDDLVRLVGGVKDRSKGLEGVYKEAEAGYARTRPSSSDHPAIKSPPKSSELKPAEKGAVARCLTLIRACKLNDGAIRLTSQGIPVWIKPYFANQAALALLASEPTKADIGQVLGWLTWYAEHVEEPLGIAPSYRGKLGQKIEKIKEIEEAYDSVDALAATYLLAVARYHRATNDTPPKVIDAAIRSLESIRKMTQEDQLTIAKPNYPVKLLRNNVEVYAGLVEGGEFFKNINRKEESKRAFVAADRLALAMKPFIQGDYFTFAIHMDGQAEPNLNEQKQALTTLYGLSFLSSSLPKDRQAQLWSILRNNFKPDGIRVPTGLIENWRVPTAPIEQWLIAGQGLSLRKTLANKMDLTDLRKQVVTEAMKFDATVYVQRPAVTVLSLVDGPARLPDVLPPDDAFAQLDLISRSGKPEPLKNDKIIFSNILWEKRTSNGTEQAPGSVVFRHDAVAVGGNDQLRLALWSGKGKSFIGSEIHPAGAEPFGLATYRLDLASQFRNLSPNTAFAMVLFPQGKGDGPSGPFFRATCRKVNGKLKYALLFAVDDTNTQGRYKSVDVDPTDAPLSMEISWRKDSVEFRLLEKQANGEYKSKADWKYDGDAVPKETSNLVLHLHIWCEKGSKPPVFDYMDIDAVKIKKLQE
jgi:hypothetical protein